MAETTATVTSSWRAKTSVRSRSNLSAQMWRARYRVNQLPSDANFPRHLAHSPLKDITDAKPAPDFLDIDRSALEGEARIARDHEQRFEPRQRGDDLLNHPIRKIVLLGISAHVLKRQHGDGWPVRKWRRT